LCDALNRIERLETIFSRLMEEHSKRGERLARLLVQARDDGEEPAFVIPEDLLKRDE
jgi:hypothetical protein